MNKTESQKAFGLRDLSILMLKKEERGNGFKMLDTQTLPHYPIEL